ncbi:MAG: tetratricopeptide repeat protein [Acidobacteria bacterium]|nr:tetratricopeptide repeat protein [Acidobacteriota bacterium]
MARKKRSIVTTVAPTAEAKSTARYQDSFQQNVGKKFEEVGKTLEGNKKNLIYGLIALVVLAAVIGIFFLWNSRTNAAAQAALAKAIETAEAPISINPVPAGSTSKQFRTAKERSQAAIPEFQAVVEQFGGPVAEKAKYFIAVNQLNLDRAVGTGELEGLVNSGGEVGMLAKFALAQIRAEDGKPDEAAALYKELAASSDPTIPKDTINLELAKIYEKQGKKQEAVDLLFGIVKTASEKKDMDGKAITLSPAVQAAKDKLKALDPEKAKEIPEPASDIPDLNQLSAP